MLANEGMLLSRFALLQGTVTNVIGSGGAKFTGVTSASFAKMQGVITSVADEGGIDNTLFGAPFSPQSKGNGSLIIAQLDLQAKIALLADTWKSVQYVDGKFNVLLKNTELAQDAPSGTLSFDATTGDINIDNSTVTLNNVKDLQVKVGDDATDFSVVDSVSGKIQGQVAVGGSNVTHNNTQDSNVANLDVYHSASGTDTRSFTWDLNSTIDAGGSVGTQVAQYQLSVTNDSLRLTATDSISLNGNGFVQKGGTLTGTAGSTSLIFANGTGQAVAGGSGNNIVVAAGTNDTLNASQSGQKLIALGQSGDVLNGQTSNKSGLDKLIAVAGTVVGGNAPQAGNDTLNAGAGNNIMIGEGVNTTFNINQPGNPNAIDVVWAKGGNDTLNITGASDVFVVDAPDATLASVKNLDVSESRPKAVQLDQECPYDGGQGAAIPRRFDRHRYRPLVDQSTKY